MSTVPYIPKRLKYGVPPNEDTIPLLKYFKEPVLTLEELEEIHPNPYAGTSMFVHEVGMFVYYNEETEEWQLLQDTTVSDWARNDIEDTALVLEAIGAQPLLISGENIKTINGESILEAGDIQTGGSDAATVNGYTVESNVPANAKFTDTTYNAATTSAAGLMSAADKTKLNGIAAGAEKNTVYSVAGMTGNVVLKDLSTTGWLQGTSYNGSTARTWSINASSANTAGAIVARNANGGFSAGDITATNIFSTGEVTAYATSDSRLKKDVNLLDHALEIIEKLNPVTFHWNEKAKSLNRHKSNGLEYGLIAQEVEKVIPTIVHPMYEQYLGIDYVSIIPILIGAVQQLIKKQQSWQ